MSDFKEIIKQHLENMAVADKSFAERYADESKNIDDCVDYIKNKACKKAVSGMAAIEDEVVFGWAAHYYQETNEDLANDVKEKTKTANTIDDKVSCTVSISKSIPTKKSPVKKENIKYIELDLFGGTV